GKTIADMLRRRVREELGITISVGVSDNKTWAKLGSDYKKPDATTVITRENVSELLHPLPVQDMLFVGRSAAEVLQRHGIMTIGMLAAVPQESLVRWLGKQGEGLYTMCHGIDASPVRRWGESDAVKSVGNGMTFPHDLVGEEAWKAGLMPLCDSVGSRLRAHHLKCRTITLAIKDPALKVISRQKTLPASTSLTKVIFREALSILRQCWREDAPIRLLTVTASTLTDADEPEPQQLSFLAEKQPDDPRQLLLEQAVDGVRQRFGRDIIVPGTTKVE
ncbi:MAG: DNA polymerase IV, partial [Clostridiales bacterium]|nr:DNA polymerase IV [Clostridiales bacterium]